MEKKEYPNRKDREDIIKVLSKATESSEDCIITTTPDGIITSWNRGAELIYGYSAKEVLEISISILDPPILVGETIELNEFIKSEDKISNYETLRVRKDNKIIDASLSLSPIFDYCENMIAILIVARDITESKKIEEKLRKNDELYRIVTEQTGQIIYNYNLVTDECSWTGAIEEVTGYSSEEFRALGKYVWITRIFPMQESIITRTSTMKSHKNRFIEELKFKKKDGTFIYIENRGILLKNDSGYAYEAIGTIKDITDLKDAITKSEESETKYRSFIQNFHGIVSQFDENFVPIFLDGDIEKITGYKEEDLMSPIGWRKIIHPDDRSFVLKEREKIQDSSSSGYVNIEYRVKKQNGNIRWVNEIFQKVYRGNGKPVIYQGTLYDITERKDTEIFLANIETARKQEIHHRIKNNLQVISSLLDLQAEQFKNKECIRDSEVIEAFRESQDRVISMALIHEELYKGGRYDTLNFSPYLEELADNIFLTYSLRNVAVSLKLDLAENVFFDMDIAIPLGMIVNELVTNSLKHAFSGRDKGEIQIGLHREEDGESIKCINEDCSNTFTLTVSDNGVGIPEGFEVEDFESLGMQLVTTLVDQLDGELELKRNNGTEFNIRFTVRENNDQELSPAQLQSVDNE